MPLIMKVVGKVICPVVVCDHCGEDIKTAKEGNYQWTPESDNLFFTHKTCCRAFEHRVPGVWAYEELSLLPLFLINNLQVDLERAKRTAALKSSL